MKCFSMKFQFLLLFLSLGGALSGQDPVQNALQRLSDLAKTMNSPSINEPRSDDPNLRILTFDFQCNADTLFFIYKVFRQGDTKPNPEYLQIKSMPFLYMDTAYFGLLKLKQHTELDAAAQIFVKIEAKKGISAFGTTEQTKWGRNDSHQFWFVEIGSVHVEKHTQTFQEMASTLNFLISHFKEKYRGVEVSPPKKPKRAFPEAFQFAGRIVMFPDNLTTPPIFPGQPDRFDFSELLEKHVEQNIARSLTEEEKQHPRISGELILDRNGKPAAIYLDIYDPEFWRPEQIKEIEALPKEGKLAFEEFRKFEKRQKLGREIVQIIMSMPNWIPGDFDGHRWEVLIPFTIDFEN